MNLSISCTSACATLLVVSASSGAVVPFTGSYTFSSSQSSGAQPAQAYNGTAIAGLAPGSVSVAGATSTNSNSNYRASGWGTGATNGSDSFTGSIDLNKYFTFTLTADSNYTFDMTSITFGLGRSGTGPRQWQWRSSVDNFASALTSITPVTGVAVSSGVMTTLDGTASTWTGNVLSLSGASFQGLSSVTFRLYGYNAEATGGTGGFQGALSFAGSTNNVPIPGAMALLGVAGLLGARRRR
jgi:hypothetical protein